MRYVHTNLVARDWRRLATFYEDVFKCIRGPERELAGVWLERGTGVAGAQIQGIHLRLPGYGSDGPTLEIFQYELPIDAGTSLPDKLGFGHIAFHVDDVEGVSQRVIAAGGATVGSVETISLAGVSITWSYVRDPEGNIIELQQSK